jgi:hypothetical protein
MKGLGSVIVITSAVIAYACGGGGDTKKDAAVDSHKRDAPSDATLDAHLDAPPDGPGNLVALTVNNYLSACSVQIGSGASSPATSATAYEAPGTVTLVATAGSGYMLGSNMWHLTNGDPGFGSAGSGSGVATLGEPGTRAGSGSSATSTAQATLAAGSAKCVWVCCPLAGGSSCDGLPDQCP